MNNKKIADNNLPFLVFHPGIELCEEMKARDITPLEFSIAISQPVDVINEILKGEKSITKELAIAIGEAFGTSADLWIGMQKEFDIFSLKNNQ